MYSSDIYNTAFTFFSSKTTNSKAVLLSNCLVAQSKHETGDYTSSLFLDSNNAFGYSYVGQSGARPSSHMNGSLPYAEYGSVSDSCLELCNWIYRRWSLFSDVSTLYGFCSALKQDGYFGDSLDNYYRGCSFFYGAPLFSVSPVVLPVVIIGCLFFLLTRQF